MILEQISLSLQKGKAKDVKALVEQAIEQGISPQDILNDGLLHGMGIIGDKFKNNEVYVPEVMIAARAMNAGTEIIKPLLGQSGIISKGKVVLGTVKGDLHDIGKNLVKMMLEGKGLEVVDLGTNVTAQNFVETAIRENANIIACSALLTTTMNEMKNVVDLLIEKGLRDKYKVMVGGAPVTQEFCDKIGADNYAPDAASCADIAVSICNLNN